MQEVGSQLRTMLLALEWRLGTKFDLEAPIIFWLIEYVAEILNRCKIQVRDNMTSYERKFGQRDAVPLVEFGEAIYYMPIGADTFEERDRKLYKADPRLFLGVFLGVERNSNEYRVGTTSGSVVKAVTIKRLPLGEQWKLELAQGVKGFPWKPAGDNVDMDKAKVDVGGDEPDEVDIPWEDEGEDTWPDADGTDELRV